MSDWRDVGAADGPRPQGPPDRRRGRPPDRHLPPSRRCRGALRDPNRCPHQGVALCLGSVRFRQAQRRAGHLRRLRPGVHPLPSTWPGVRCAYGIEPDHPSCVSPSTRHGPRTAACCSARCAVRARRWRDEYDLVVRGGRVVGPRRSVADVAVERDDRRDRLGLRGAARSTPTGARDPGRDRRPRAHADRAPRDVYDDTWRRDDGGRVRRRDDDRRPGAGRARTLAPRRPRRAAGRGRGQVVSTTRST